MPNKVFRPLLDRVLLRPIDLPEFKMVGHIAIPNVTKPGQEDTGYAVVVAIGPGYIPTNGYDHVEMTVKPGDLVSYNKKIGKAFRLNGENLWLLYEREIDGVIEEDFAKAIAENQTQ